MNNILNLLDELNKNSLNIPKILDNEKNECLDKSKIINKKILIEFQKYEIEFDILKKQFIKINYKDLLKINYDLNKTVININSLKKNHIKSFINDEIKNELLKISNNLFSSLHLDNKYLYFYYNFLKYDNNINIVTIHNQHIYKFLYYYYLNISKFDYKNINYFLKTDFSYYLNQINVSIKKFNNNFKKEQNLLYNYFNNLLEANEIYYDKYNLLKSEIDYNFNKLNLNIRNNSYEIYEDIRINNIEEYKLNLINQNNDLKKNKNYEIYYKLEQEVEKNNNYLKKLFDRIKNIELKILNKNNLVIKLKKESDIKYINKIIKTNILLNSIDNNHILIYKNNIKKLINLNKNNYKITHLNDKIIEIRNILNEYKLEIVNCEKKRSNYEFKIKEIDNTNYEEDYLKKKYKIVKDTYIKNIENIDMEIYKLKQKIQLEKSKLNLFKSELKIEKKELEKYELNNQNKIDKNNVLIKNLQKDIKMRKIDIQKFKNNNLSNLKIELGELIKLKKEVISLNLKVEEKKEYLIELDNKMKIEYDNLFSLRQYYKENYKIIQELENGIIKIKELTRNNLDNILKNKTDLTTYFQNNKRKLEIKKIHKFNNEYINIFIDSFNLFLEDLHHNYFNLNNYYNINIFLENIYDKKKLMFNKKCDILGKNELDIDKELELSKLEINNLNIDIVNKQKENIKVFFETIQEYLNEEDLNKKKYKIVLKLIKENIEIKNKIKEVKKYIKKYS